jgi:hypothetical protein
MSIRMGERKRGSTVLPARAQFRDGDRLGSMQRRDAGAIPKALSPLNFGRCHRAALYAARVLVGAGVSVTASDERGERPPFGCPLLRPMVQLEGVAHAPIPLSRSSGRTARLLRQLSNAPPDSAATTTPFVRVRAVADRFYRELAFM